MSRLFETCLECSWKSRLHQGGHEHHLGLGRALGARLSLQKDQREDAGHQTWSEGEQVPWLWLHHKQGTVIFIFPWIEVYLLNLPGELGNIRLEKCPPCILASP